MATWFECQVRYGVMGPGCWNGKVVVHATSLVREVCQLRGESAANAQALVRKKLAQSKAINRRSVIFLNTHPIPTPSWAKES